LLCRLAVEVERVSRVELKDDADAWREERECKRVRRWGRSGRRGVRRGSREKSESSFWDWVDVSWVGLDDSGGEEEGSSERRVLLLPEGRLALLFGLVADCARSRSVRRSLIRREMASRWRGWVKRVRRWSSFVRVGRRGVGRADG
jgi:hypothetical protein